jgi:hypothetical protein
MREAPVLSGRSLPIGAAGLAAAGVVGTALPATGGPAAGGGRPVADIYRRHLDVALDPPAVKALMTFGLSDRYTWLQEDLPREDGAPRRPLPFTDEGLRPKPAYRALSHSLKNAPWRRPVRRLHREEGSGR